MRGEERREKEKGRGEEGRGGSERGGRGKRRRVCGREEGEGKRRGGSRGEKELKRNTNPMCSLCWQSDRWYFIDDGPLFDTLEGAIDHYMLFPDGLPTILRYPVPPPASKPLPNPTRKVNR